MDDVDVGVGLSVSRGPIEPGEVGRARAVIWTNLACVLVWIVILGVASVWLGNPRLAGVAGVAAAMAATWTVALRLVSGGRMSAGVATYTVSGLLLLLAMGLFVPELSVLFTFATFIFLAFGLSYTDGRHSARVVGLTLAVAAVLLATSSVLRWRSGVPEQLLRWVNLTGMLMALSIDAMSFIMLRRALEARGQRLLAAEREATQMQRRIARQERLESLGKLAGGIAHDFNNLLGVMINYCGFVAEAVDDQPDVLADVDAVREAAHRAAALTRQLLIFGRRTLVRVEVVDVNVVVSETESLLRSAIGEHIDLHTRLAQGQLTARVDRSRLEQVLLNLSVNARDAMPDGGSLLIETSQREFSAHADDAVPAPGRYVCVNVTDTGCGFSDEAREHAFEPFFTTKPVGEGTGLGLATIHGIVTEAGGDIRLYSEIGVGTTVRVYIPAATGSANVDAPGLGAATFDGGGRAVLLVEDELQLRRSTARLLERHNYLVHAVDRPHDALALLENGQRFAVLLTDVVMPGMSGLQLAQRARRARPDLCVLFMSGFPRDLWERGQPERDIALIEKPFDAEQLLRKLADTLTHVDPDERTPPATEEGYAPAESECADE